MDQRDIDRLLVQIQFPQMPQAESDIARAWVREYAKYYDSLDFNVRLGKGAELQPGLPAYTQDQFTRITQKRADIIGHVGSFVDIIEVKVKASFGAAGQLQGYRHLWADDYPQNIVRRLIVVAQIIDQDVARVYQLNSITFYKVTPEVWQ